VSYLASPTSVMTYGTTESFRFDCLNYEFIQKCTDEETLREMLAYLETKGRYPALLCETQKRLTQLHRRAVEKSDVSKSQTFGYPSC
jgi:hypothetical protein